MTKKLLALGIIVSGSLAILPACVGVKSTPIDGIITRKYEYADATPKRYEVWVEYKDSGDAKLIKYNVEEDYYKSSNIGDAFNEKYAIGEGVTELNIEE